jgi:hypothetical protein
MSFFDNVENLDEIPDDPFALPDNTYLCRIVEATHDHTKNDKNKFGILVKYQIIEGPFSSFFPFGEWLHTPNPSDDPNDMQTMRSYANLKKHFMAYGFGADELKSVTVEDLKDREVYVKTYTKKDKEGRNNIRIADLTPVDGADEFFPKSDDGFTNF